MTQLKYNVFSSLIALLGLSFAGPALAADEMEIKDNILIELNATQSTDESCTFTFQVINGYSTDIQKAVYEAVLFDRKGTVNRLTLFDFGALPAGRPRVRQFVVQGVQCSGLGQVLINGAHACDATNLDASACETDLRLMSLSEIEVAG